MGTGHLWLALLLALLQYAAVPVDGSVQCQVKTKLKSDCSGFESYGCSEVVLTDDNDKTCSDGRILYYKKGADWTETGKLSCGKTGVWTATKEATNIDLETGNEVICAAWNPAESAPCLKSQLQSVCTDSSLVHDKAKENCKDVKLFDTRDATLECPNDKAAGATTYYKAVSKEWKEETITCVNGKWHDGSDPVSAGANVVCTTENPKEVKCDSGKLTTECVSLDPSSVAVEKCDKVPSITDVVVDACVAKTMYYKVPNAIWVKAENLHCYTGSGEWIEGAKGQETILSSVNVICAERDPNLLSCSKKSLLKSGCNSFPQHVKCKLVNFPNDVPSACDSGASYYVKVAGGTGKWEMATAITCVKGTGEWKAASTLEINLRANDEIICAEKTPNPDTCNCAAPLPSTCTGLDATYECVEIVQYGNTPDCPAGKSLYFKNNAEATTKWMAGTVLRCVDQNWQITYKFGKTEKNEPFAAETGKVICAKSNPDSDVCHFARVAADSKYAFDAIDSAKKFAAGEEASCGNEAEKKHHVFVPDNSEAPLSSTRPPVCKMDGTWSDSDGEDYATKINCAKRNCKRCNMVPVLALTFEGMENSGLDINDNGDCSSLTCPYEQLIAVKTTEDKYYFAKKEHVQCSDDRSPSWQIDYALKDEEKQVTAAQCAQRGYCLNIADTHIEEINYKCPTAPNELPGCKDAVPKKDEGRVDKQPANNLECPDATKMFMRVDSVGCYREIETRTTKCNEFSGQWDAQVVNEYGKTSTENLDYRHSIICAATNPKVCPTTTTTTTTPAPLLPICEECQRLPGFSIDSKEHMRFRNYTEECEMTSNSQDYKLVINSMEEIDALICKRSTLKWTKKDGTGGVDNVSARLDVKKNTWKTLSYVIVAAVIIAIGGLAIGCFLIYAKMRKSTSEGGNKKKERGATKKYVKSKIKRTFSKGPKKSKKKSKGKSNAKSTTGESIEGSSREDGKSQTGITGNSVSQFENAPTLKL